jgi:hypothetical protein
MTVCIAALAAWNYAKIGDPEDWGYVGISAADRMITFGDVQYEPIQQKMAPMGKTMLLIAGDYSLHSEAIQTTQHELIKRPHASPHDIALIYGRTIQSIKRRHAEDIILAPLGLNTDILNEMSGGNADRLITQMQEYRGEVVEAVILGMENNLDKKLDASIYHIDTRGSVTCANDVGFAAIGSGAWHANSQLMQSGYTKRFPYFSALAALFAAKKAADVSPGVGDTYTDINVLFRHFGPEQLLQEQHAKLQELYLDFIAKRTELSQQAIKGLTDFVAERSEARKNEQGQGQPGTDAKADAGASPNETEAPRGNEGREENEAR